MNYLNHGEELNRYWIIDVEGDLIPSTRIWCAVAINAATREVVRLVGEDVVKRFIEANRDAYWVTQNGLGYDVPTLNRLLGVGIPDDRVVDLLVLTNLYNPKLPASLADWGIRLRKPKGEWSDFSKFSPEMLEYCVRDAEITCDAFMALTARMRRIGFSERSCKLEHEARCVILEQMANGFRFDQPSAVALAQTLRTKAYALEGPIQVLFPPQLVSVGTYKRRFKSDGGDYASYVKHLIKYPKVEDNEDGTYTTFDWQEFNLGSPKQRIERLLELGFVPTKFTKRTANGGGGNPQVDEDSLLDFAKQSGRPEISALAEWLVLSSRASMVESWIGCVKDDGRIHGWVNSCGASSRRMTHNSPNTANIPGNEAPYGSECRDLWIPNDGHIQLGYDAKAAQMRIFGHYLGDEATARLYIEGDPHQVNADNIGIPRKPTKNVFYAFIFGAQDPKLGTTAHPGVVLTKTKAKAEGKRIRSILYKTTPGLERLMEECEAEFNATPDHFLSCIDGGFVRCPSPHAALNYRIQSAEACMMKQAGIFIRQRARHIDHMKVGDIHDEGQHSVVQAASEELGRICVQAIRDAGEELNFTVPMDGDYRTGTSWRYTH